MGFNVFSAGAGVVVLRSFDAPSNLTVLPNGTSSTSVILNWTSNTNSSESGFSIERSAHGANSWSVIGTVATNVTTYTDSGLTQGTQYDYRVRAYAGASTFSGYTTASGYTLCAGPTSLAAGTPTQTTIPISWTSNSAGLETSFLAVVATDSQFLNVVSSQTFPSGSTTATVTGLTSSATYYIKLYAVNGAGNSAPSNTATATTTGSQGNVLLTSATLTNTSNTTATPASTYLTIGHPFVKADLAGWNAGTNCLSATWTPSGGIPQSVPVQVSSQRTWSDGSLAFSAIGLLLPSIASSGTGTLSLYRSSGSQNTTLPGGKTVSQVLTDLTTNFPFTVTAANLYKGRESITVTAAGSGYRSTDTVSISGGTPSQSGTSTQLTVNGSGGITAVKINPPAQTYTVAPTLTINTSTGSGATLTYNLATRDGSGSWTWTANTYLSTYGGTFTQGSYTRTHCEVVEQGPLCVTFTCWGPFADNTGGALHPHLVVRAWYRCWLNQTTGAIDRVEHLHSLEQGWIGDLAGGSVQTNAEVGDFTVNLNASAVTGLSFSHIRIPHHTCWALATSDMTTAGSLWTTGKPTLRTTFSKTYWRSTSIIPPFDLEYFQSNALSPSADASPIAYQPGAHADSGNGGSQQKIGKFLMSVDATGGRPDIGVIPAWSAAAYLSQESGYIQTDMACGLLWGSIPVRIRNPATGRIPVIVGTQAYTPTAALGTNLPNTYYLSYSSRSTDFALAPSADTNGSTVDVTSTDGGWYATTGYEMSHWAAGSFHPYLRSGAPWLLEQIRLDANHAIMKVGVGTTTYGSYRTKNLPDGSTIYDSFMFYYVERQEAWSYRSVYQFLAVAPDADYARAYLQKVWSDNAGGAVSVINGMGANFRALGVWNTPLGTSPNYHYAGSPWMEDYIFAVRACEYLALDRPANTLTFLNHYVKALKGKGGGDVGQTCPWPIGPYHNTYGSTDYFADWSKMPYYAMDSSVSFTASSPWVTGLSKSFLANNTAALQVGDMVMFTNYSVLLGAISNPPAQGTLADSTVVNIVPGQFYYVAQSDTTNNRIQISPNPDGSNPFVSFSSSVASTLPSVRYATCPVPNPTQPAGINTYFGTQETYGADSYPSYYAACFYLGQAAGVINGSDTWATTLNTRLNNMVANRWIPSNQWTSAADGCQWKLSTHT